MKKQRGYMLKVQSISLENKYIITFLRNRENTVFLKKMQGVYSVYSSIFSTTSQITTTQQAI